MTEAADVSYIENKGWKSPADLYKSYRGAETLIGRDPNSLIAIPRADDPAGLRAAYAKLGMPAEASKYTIFAPEGAQVNEGYANWARETFHKLGLSVAQGHELTKSYTEFSQKTANEATATYERSVAVDKGTLQREWGGGFERMMGAAKTAKNALGFTDQMVDALEMEIGYAGVMKFFAGLGQKLGEDSFVGSDNGGGQRFNGTMTPDEARQQWEAMKLDTTQMAALKDNSHPGHEGAKKKQTDLFKIMYPEG